MPTNAGEMEPEELLKDWASRHEMVHRLWIIGSRARRDHRPDSDYDIVFDLDPKHRFGGPFLLMANHSKKWSNELQEILGVPVEIFAYETGLEQDPDFQPQWTARERVEEEGVLVFSRPLV